MPSTGQWLLILGPVVLFGGSFLIPTDVATSSLALNPFAWGTVIMCVGVWVSLSEDKRRY